MVAELTRRLASGVATGDVAIRAAGLTDVGRQRDVNEDRLHVDIARGIFIVVDGVGGQAAGGRAADIALRMLRERLERQTGAVVDRVREAITIANNEIFHQARQRPEWHGMACVLTVAVINERRLVIGHVGDTRLYVFHGGQARKLTPDHSPVGEREDARELSELEAMRHPRRNEVFRDVGSTVHHLADREFIHVDDVAFPDDAALLICSDGLTDLVPLATIRQAVETCSGRPEAVVRTLVQAANDAGGKDNVTVVYAEGVRFATRAAVDPARGPVPAVRDRRSSSGVWKGFFAGLLIAAGLGGWWAWHEGLIGRDLVVGTIAPAPQAGAIVVRAGESIAEAIARAEPGFSIVVEPGEYRERLTLRDHVRVISRVPRGVTLRRPSESIADDAVVTAAGVMGAELSGFRIVGDDAAPLDVGVLTRDGSTRFVDLEISGARTAAVAFGPGDDVLVASDIRDNPGAAIVAAPRASPRIAHNRFARNGTLTTAPFVFEPGAVPQISGNVFQGLDVRALAGLGDEAVRGLPADNMFIEPRPAASSARPSPAPRSR